MNRRSFLGKAFAGVAGMAAAAFGLLAGKREPEPRIYKDDQSELASKQWMRLSRAHHSIHKSWAKELKIVHAGPGTEPSTARVRILRALLRRDDLQIWDKVTIFEGRERIFVGYVDGWTDSFDGLITMTLQDARGLMTPTLQPGWTEKEQQAFTDRVQFDSDDPSESKYPWVDRGYRIPQDGQSWDDIFASQEFKDVSKQAHDEFYKMLNLWKHNA